MQQPVVYGKLAASSATARPTFTHPVIAPFYKEPFTVNNGVREFFPCGGVYGLHSCSGNVHLIRTLFLSHALQVDQTHSLIFINQHYDGSGRFRTVPRSDRGEMNIFG